MLELAELACKSGSCISLPHLHANGCHIGSLKSAMVKICTPETLVNTTN